MKSMFWGVIIIVIGLSVLLGAVFGIDVPVFRILLGLFLVYFGLKVILGAFSWDIDFVRQKRSSDHESVFAEAQFQYPNRHNSKQYVTVFGSSRLDLSNATELAGQELEVISVFGNSDVILKKGTPLRVESNTVFAKAELPGKNISAFGQFHYSTPGLKEEEPALLLKTTAVFGSTKIEERE